MKKSNKGITLVALVITIIILLILAGITISQLTGNGLFENAKLAKEKSENSQEKEDGILGDYENKIGEYIDGNREENNAQKWKKLTSVTGGTSITLPSTFSEIKIVSEISSGRAYTVNVIYEELTSEQKLYTEGMYPGNSGVYYAGWWVTNQSVYLAGFFEFSDETQNAITTVYYK